MSARRDDLDARAGAILLACCLFWGVQQVLVKATLPELAPVFQAAVRFVGALLLLWLWCAWRGDLLGLAGGALWGLTTITIRSTSLARLLPEKMLFYQVAVAAISLPLVSLALGESWNWQWSPFAATSMLLQTVVGAFVSYLAWMWLLAHYPATRISVFVFLTPLFALAAGALWLKEPVTSGLVAALVLVAVGIVLVNRRAQPGKPLAQTARPQPQPQPKAAEPGAPVSSEFTS